jgi:hypothetical protein
MVVESFTLGGENLLQRNKEHPSNSVASSMILRKKKQALSKWFTFSNLIFVLCMCVVYGGIYLWNHFQIMHLYEMNFSQEQKVRTMMDERETLLAELNRRTSYEPITLNAMRFGLQISRTPIVEIPVDARKDAEP